MLDKNNLNSKPLQNHHCFPHTWVTVLNIQLRNLVIKLRCWSKSQRKLNLFDPCNLTAFILFELVFNPMTATREPNLHHQYDRDDDHYSLLLTDGQVLEKSSSVSLGYWLFLKREISSENLWHIFYLLTETETDQSLQDLIISPVS